MAVLYTQPFQSNFLSLSTPSEDQGSVLGINQSFALGRVGVLAVPDLFINKYFLSVLDWWNVFAAIVLPVNAKVYRKKVIQYN